MKKPTLFSIDKEFDNIRVFYGKNIVEPLCISETQEKAIKDFYRQQIKKILKYLSIEKRELSNYFKETNRIELTRDKIYSGYNHAVHELNKRIKEIKVL